MARKQFFLLIDTETTQTDMVADFGALVVDRKGEVFASAALLVREFYCDSVNHSLFHYSDKVDPLWGQHKLPERYANYDAMLSTGSRMLASVPAINRWLAKVYAKYNPTATAYNWAFDFGKMRNTGFDVDLMANNFCLWHASASVWGKTRDYKQVILDEHLFKARTKLGNMSYPTNAEVMARFITGNQALPDEPHTAYEDARDYELPILVALLKNRTLAEVKAATEGYNWRNFQVRDHFMPK